MFKVVNWHAGPEDWSVTSQDRNKTVEHQLHAMQATWLARCSASASRVPTLPPCPTLQWASRTCPGWQAQPSPCGRWCDAGRQPASARTRTPGQSHPAEATPGQTHQAEVIPQHKQQVKHARLRSHALPFFPPTKARQLDLRISTSVRLRHMN